MSSADVEAAVERAMAEKDPGLWHPAIDLAAAAVLGVTQAVNHPVTLRAQELIPGLLTHYDRLISEKAMSPAQAAREYDTLAEGHASFAAVAILGLAGDAHPPPPNPPTTMKHSYLPVRHLGGHPALAAGKKGLWLLISAPGVSVFTDPRAKREIGTLQWSKLSGLEIEGPDTIGSRVTVPRLAAGGLFAFAFKKEQKRAYLVFRTHTGGDVIFDVPGKSPRELQAELSPVLKWLGGATTDDRPSE